MFVRYPVSRKEDEVLLISQYRPPVGAEVRRRGRVVGFPSKVVGVFRWGV